MINLIREHRLLVTSLVACAAILLHHLAGYYGHYGYDDMMYAEPAHKLAEGHFTLTDNHYTYRWFPISMTALAYQIFGVSDTGSVFFPLLLTCATAIGIGYLLKKDHSTTLIIGVALFALNKIILLYSDALMPAMYIAFSVFIVFGSIYHFKFMASSQHPFGHAFLFSLGLMLAFLCKGTVVLALPIFLAVFLSDIVQQKDLPFWKWAIGKCLILFCAYFLIIYLLEGNFLQRLYAIASDDYVSSTCSYGHLPLQATLDRISHELVNSFIRHGMVIAPLLCVAGTFQTPWRKLVRMSDPASFAISCTAVGLLACNFMTISHKGYVPLCPDIRHYLFIQPIAVIGAAPVARRWLFHRKGRLTMLIGMVVIAAIAYWNNNWILKIGYLPLLGITLGRYFLPTSLSYCGRLTMPAVFLVVLIPPPLQNISNARNTPYRVQKEATRQLFKGMKEKSFVVTNPVQKNLGAYNIVFDTTSTFFVRYDADARLRRPADSNRTTYLFLNGHTRYLSGIKWYQLPRYARNPPSSGELVFDKKGVKVYRYPSPKPLIEKADSLSN
jgi:hypothetical protein